MATRVLGPTGSRRRRRFLFVSLFLVACTALFLAGSAQAVHEFAFQLDGDVSSQAYSVPNSANQLYDWGANTAGNVSTQASPNTKGLFTESLSGSTETVTVNSALVGSGKPFAAAAFNRDFESGGCDTPANLSSTSTAYCTHDDSTYATGSKDILGIGNGGWQCNHDNNVNNKIDIMNAYTASFFTGPNQTGDHIIYFGLEKNTSNGTNDVGVWLLQGSASCSAPSGHLNFNGGHVNKDVLVVSEFSNGGGVSSIKAFQWAAAASGPLSGDGGCIDSNDNPNPATGGCNGQPISTSNADCKVSGGNDSLCATTNANCTSATLACGKPWNQTVSTPWLTANGSSVGRNQIVSPDFFEGGIDITKVFGQAGQAAPNCFSTVVPDTRSSATLTATLFDFVTNQLGECHTDVHTTPVDAATHGNPPASTIPAADANADVTVQDKATIGVSGISSFTGSISWHICGRTDPSSTQLCDGTTGNVGVDLGSTPANANGDFFSPVVHITAAGRYCFRAEFSSTTTGVPPGSDSSSGECFTIAPRTPTLTTNATAAVETGTALNDVAHLGNTAKQPGTGGPAGASPVGSINPTQFGDVARGTITFTLYSAGVSSHCGTAIATRTVNVSGNGNYNANDPAATGSGSLSPGPGTYYWRAVYSGDPPNTVGQNTPCDDANESSVVVDAKISITPNGVNKVGDSHTFTVLLQKDIGNGSGFGPAVGETVHVTLTNDATAVANPAGPFDLTTDAQGKATVTFTSATAGVVTGNASASLNISTNGATVGLSRATGDSHTGDSGSATKRFVDANVTITPNGVNEVNHQHTFTITTTAFPAGTTPSLTSLSVTYSPSDPGSKTACVPSGSGNTRSCTVTINSSVAGTFTANATAVWGFHDSDAGANPADASVTRSTSGTSGPGGSGAATKRFVDAYITINPPDKTNSVGQAHTDTVNVFVDNGNHVPGINVWENAPNGTIVQITLTNDPSDPGATPVLVTPGDVCGTLGTSNGACTITFSSATAGTVIAHASVDVLAGGVGGVLVHRETDGNAPNSGNAIKHFKAGAIKWFKDDDAGRPLAGATFQLCQISSYDVATDSFVPLPSYPPGDCQTVVDNSPPDENSAGGVFQVSGLQLGQYKVHETVAPAGYVPDPTTKDAQLTPQNSGTVQVISVHFVNTRPVLKITGFSYDNAPDGLPQPDGIFKGVVTYTVKLHNYGTADATDLTGSALSVSNASPSTGLTCDAAPSFAADSVLVNGDLTKTLTCHYNNPNGKVITAQLNVQYTTNGTTRIASGSPATISFTVNPN
jgi:prealbumin domain-containing protein